MDQVADTSPSLTPDAMDLTKGKHEDPLSSAVSRFDNSETLFQVAVQDLPIQMTMQMD